MKGKNSKIIKDEFQVSGMSSWKYRLQEKWNWRGRKDQKFSFSHVQMQKFPNENIGKEQQDKALWNPRERGAC